MQRSMWRKSLISHISQTDIAHPTEELPRSPELGHHNFLLISIHSGPLVLIYVTFFHHIYDINILKLKNVVPSIVLGYYSQANLCILITLKAFIHFLELGQFVMQFILEKFSSFLKIIHHQRDILGNVHLMFIFSLLQIDRLFILLLEGFNNKSTFIAIFFFGMLTSWY
jgi:hypothetical protein